MQRGRFSHEDIFRRLQQTVFEKASERVEAYCVDDTGFEKKGDRSAGVQRQYSGTLGKVGNCQVAVSLHAISDSFSACLGAQLYMPKDWLKEPERLEAAKVPESIEFKTKTAMAIDLLKAAKEAGAPKRPVVSDAGYGDSREFRDSIAELGWDYAVAVSSTTTVWPPGAKPQRPPRTGASGRPRTQDRDPSGKRPIRVAALAKEHWEQGGFRKVTWRRGSNGPLSGTFCVLRVHSAERTTKGLPAGPTIWLLIERDESQTTNFKYYLSSMPSNTPVKTIARFVKMRWRIERDYQDMKQKLGLDKYEGRQWGGFHRHFAMVALMHAFLSLYRESFSPGGDVLDMDGLQQSCS